MIDRYTRTVKIKIAKRIDSQELIENLEVWCKQYGKPKTLKSDQGRQYLSKAFNDWLRINDIKLKTTPTYYPQNNGISERINSVIKQFLRTYKGQELTRM